MEAVLPSIITGLVTMTGSILTFIATNKKYKMEQDETSKRQMEQLRDSIVHRMDVDKEEAHESMEQINAHMKAYADNFLELRAQTQTYQAVMEERFNHLEAKVSKHNQFMERIAVLEKDSAVLQNRESVSEHRLTDIERALTHEKEA